MEVKKNENKIEDIFAEIGETPRPKEPEKEKIPVLLRKREIRKRKFSWAFLIAFIIVFVFILAFVFIFTYARFKLLKRNKRILTKQETIIPKENFNKKITIIDTDKDNLTDAEERQLKTNPKKIDTDNDNLTDYEEVKIYKTNPLKKDTDGDGISDGEEIKRGLDPNNPNPNAKLLDLKKEIEKLK